MYGLPLQFWLNVRGSVRMNICHRTGITVSPGQPLGHAGAEADIARSFVCVQVRANTEDGSTLNIECSLMTGDVVLECSKSQWEVLGSLVDLLRTRISAVCRFNLALVIHNVDDAETHEMGRVLAYTLHVQNRCDRCLQLRLGHVLCSEGISIALFKDFALRMKKKLVYASNLKYNPISGDTEGLEFSCELDISMQCIWRRQVVWLKSFCLYQWALESQSRKILPRELGKRCRSKAAALRRHWVRFVLNSTADKEWDTRGTTRNHRMSQCRQHGKFTLLARQPLYALILFVIVYIANACLGRNMWLQLAPMVW